MCNHTKSAIISICIAALCVRDPFEFGGNSQEHILAQARIQFGTDEHVVVMHENGNVARVKVGSQKAATLPNRE